MKPSQNNVFFLAFLSLFLTHPFLLQGQGPGVQQLQGQFERFQTTLSPQKIFIHFDKEQYASGETIWLKGYLVNASDQTPVLDSANVYLELWNIRDEKILELIFQPRGGVFQGQIALARDIPDGNYAIRAYSDWMLNQAEDTWFRKSLYVSNPGFANQIDNDARNFNRSFNETLRNSREAVRVEFFPEGGGLVEGLVSRVAIKVSDGLGKGRNVRGQIRDQDGVLVADFETGSNGLGLISIRPEAGKRYVAELPGARRAAFTVPLPAAREEGFVLRADLREEELEVRISGSRSMLGHSLMVQSKGVMLVMKTGLPDEKDQVFRFPLTNFPTGLTQLVLLSPEAAPLAERLVFVNKDDQIYFDMNARVLRSGEDAFLSIDVLSSDQAGDPVKGNFSVAVQYGDVGERTLYDNIFSNVLLGSELGGFIEAPARYFDYSLGESEAMLDLLVMTRTWQGFQWSEWLSHGLPQVNHQPAYGVDVEGSLVAPREQIGIGNAEVRLRVVEDPSKTFEARTNAEGKFLFRGLPLVDTTMVEIIPPMIAGRQLPDVKLNASGRVDPGIAPMVFVPDANTLPQQITERGRNWSRPRTGRSSTQPERGGQLFGTPDQTIYLDNNEPYTSILEVLRDKAIGVNIAPSGFITIRGITSINYQNPPLFFVDGVESEGAFLSLHPRDVERIEIFKGASTAAFGARGASGALAAYTRRRDYQAELLSSSMFLVNGLHAPIAFQEEADLMAGFDNINKVKTLFWEPQLQSGQEGVANFQFRLAPGVSQFRIIIQGVGENGKIGYAEFILGN